MKTLPQRLYALAAITTLSLGGGGQAALAQGQGAASGTTKVSIAKGQADKTTTPKLLEDEEIILQLGEQRVFDLKGVTRLSIENPDLVNQQTARERPGMMTVFGLQVGITTLTVTGKQEPIIRYTRVYAPTPESVLQEASAAGALRINDECLKGRRLGTRQLRLVLDPKGRVTTAQIDEREGIDEARYKCLTHAARQWRFNTKDSVLYTVGLIRVEL